MPTSTLLWQSSQKRKFVQSTPLWPNQILPRPISSFGHIWQEKSTTLVGDCACVLHIPTKFLREHWWLGSLKVLGLRNKGSGVTTSSAMIWLKYYERDVCNILKKTIQPVPTKFIQIITDLSTTKDIDRWAKKIWTCQYPTAPLNLSSDQNGSCGADRVRGKGRWGTGLRAGGGRKGGGGGIENGLVWFGLLRIYVALAVFQPYRDLEAGDNQSLKIQVARRGIEPRTSCSASQELKIENVKKG